MASKAVRGIADWSRRLALTEEEATDLVTAAAEEGRAITNMVRHLVVTGLRSRKKGKR